MYGQRSIIHPSISIPSIPECAGLWTVTGTCLTIHEPRWSTFRSFCRNLKIETYVSAQYYFTYWDTAFTFPIYETTTNIFILLQSWLWVSIIFYTYHPKPIWSEMEMTIIAVIVFVWIPSVWNSIFLVGAKYLWIVIEYIANWGNDQLTTTTYSI